MSGNGLGWSVKTNLRFGMGSGDSCQDCFEGTKYFGHPLRGIDIDHGFYAPKVPANSVSLLN